MGNALPPGTQVSPDGKWYWDGSKWAPVTLPAPAQPGFPPPYPYPYATQRTNSLSIASLVSGVLAWVVCPFLGAILAVIFGHVARGQIKQSGEAGGGMAIAGLVLGYANLAVTVLGIIVWIFLIAGVAILGPLIPSASPSP
ncbi:MAG TPA: DUF4190 domain-containing protein [Candidatus Dormibacteraeota bacterium]|nr:DUF4190 domain-containing protein [Candidatus Dormibacteraeota bacterium]